MKTFKQLAAESAELAVYFQRKYRRISYGAGGACIFNAIVCVFFALAAQQLLTWLAAASFIHLCLSIWMACLWKRARNDSKQTFKEWMERREQHLRMAEIWKEYE